MLPGGRCPPRSSEEDAVTVSQIRAAATKMHYAWIIAALTFAVLFLGAGVRAAPGVLIVPLESEFHWSRATISLAIGINLLLYGLVGPFAAAFDGPLRRPSHDVAGAGSDRRRR